MIWLWLIAWAALNIGFVFGCWWGSRGLRAELEQSIAREQRWRAVVANAHTREERYRVLCDGLIKMVDQAIPKTDERFDWKAAGL